jgi:PIN domain nuclease of toxin-antitoxin system
VKVLLDTNVLLWWLTASPRLNDRSRDLISDPAGEVLVSVVSLWEIAIKVRIGKLQADIGEIEVQIGREGFRRVAITSAHLTALMPLPQHHRDPFDHLLMAQALSEEATFLTGDRQVAQYPVPAILSA